MSGLDEHTKTELTAKVVSAYIASNNLPAAELPSLLKQVHATLAELSAPPKEPKAERGQPAVSIRNSITTEYLICLEDGKKFKSLKRHLRTRHGMTPEQYRDRWTLPFDYPMVPSAYSAARATLAKNAGFGRKRTAPSAVAPRSAAVESVPTPKASSKSPSPAPVRRK